MNFRNIINNLLVQWLALFVSCDSSKGQSQDALNWLDEQCVVFSSTDKNDLLILCKCKSQAVAWDFYGQNVYQNIRINKTSNTEITIMSESTLLVDHYEVKSIHENVMLLVNENDTDLRAYKLVSNVEYCKSLSADAKDRHSFELFVDRIQADHIELLKALSPK